MQLAIITLYSDRNYSTVIFNKLYRTYRSNYVQVCQSILLKWSVIVSI